MSVTWTNEKRKLGELIPWPRNPRKISVGQAKRLHSSFEEFGQVDMIAIGPDSDIYNGHQRLHVLMEKYGPDYEVEVRVASQPLTEKQREKLTIFLHKGTTGEWDYDLLDDFELTDLLLWGFEPYELGPGDDEFSPEGEWVGMPEYTQENHEGIIIKVHFATEADRDEFAELIGQKITDKTRAIWYPYRAPMELKKVRFKGES